MKKLKKILKILFIVLLLLLGTTGTYVGMHYRDVSNWIARQAGKDASKQEQRLKIKHNRVSNLSENEKSKLQYGGAVKDDLTSPIKIWQYAHDHSYPLGYVGRVAIPTRNINLPINHGSNNRVLAVGAGTLKDSFATAPYNEKNIMGESNFAICGHNMDDHYTLFSAVPDMANGENIYTYNGHRIFKYQKYSMQIVSPSDISVIFNTRDTDKHPIITITTCNYSGSARYVVRGQLKKIYTKNNVPQKIKRLFIYKK
jgi:sortase A